MDASGHHSPDFRSVVLLPTYNERDNLPEIVPCILAAAPVDVWILDDASPDGTGDIADALAAADRRVHVLHRSSKQGLGPAYIDGFRCALQAGYDRILTMDADFAHPVQTIPELLRLSERYDLVVGSRWIEGGRTENWPWYRKFISRSGSFYARSWLGVSMRDMTSGFRCYRRELLLAIDADQIRTTGYAFQIELAYRALRGGFRVIETPITFVERRLGTSKMSRRIVLEAIVRIPRLRFEVKH